MNGGAAEILARQIISKAHTEIHIAAFLFM